MRPSQRSTFGCPCPRLGTRCSRGLSFSPSRDSTSDDRASTLHQPRDSRSSTLQYAARRPVTGRWISCGITPALAGSFVPIHRPQNLVLHGGSAVLSNLYTFGWHGPPTRYLPRSGESCVAFYPIRRHRALAHILRAPLGSPLYSTFVLFLLRADTRRRHRRRRQTRSLRSRGLRLGTSRGHLFPVHEPRRRHTLVARAGRASNLFYLDAGRSIATALPLGCLPRVSHASDLSSRVTPAFNVSLDSIASNVSRLPAPRCSRECNVFCVFSVP